MPSAHDKPAPGSAAGAGPAGRLGQDREQDQGQDQDKDKGEDQDENQDGAGPELIEQLARESRQFDATGADPERNCWLVVHRHHHGVLPSEYDIREIPEDLYLAVLAARRASEALR